MPIEGSGAGPTQFTTQVARLGVGGLQLNRALDVLTPQECSRLSNLLTTGNGQLSTRPGQNRFANASGALHSIRRLNDPHGATHSSFYGGGSAWWRGQTGGLLSLEGGFSGNPLTQIPVRPNFSGESWMLAADSLKMRKATLYSPSLPVGLPIPVAAPTAGVDSLLTTGIASFDSSDGTDSAAWIKFAGPSTASPPNAPIPVVSGVPVLSDVPAQQGNGVMLLTAPGASVNNGYASIMCKAIPLDLTKLQGGTVASTLDDIIHMWLRMSDPASIDSIRLYFVVSAWYDGALAIPGTSDIYNQSAYLWTFRPSDYTQFVADVATSALDVAATVQDSNLLNTFTGAASKPSSPIAAANPPVTASGPGVPADVTSPGANAWTDFGRIGLPVRKSDFIQIGQAGQPGTDWSTVTGVYLIVEVADPPVNATGQALTPSQSVAVTFDDCYMTGGHNLDSSEPGAQQYDYRVINYDPRTGARSNPSPLLTTFLFDGVTLAGSLPFDALRQDAAIYPPAYGDPNIRQEAYRRGGSVTDNWYYVGVNTTDGGIVYDNVSDAGASAADTVPQDHFQPVPTVDFTGAAVYAQAVPIVFGPIDGILCALGDPYRPGHLYSCISGEPDHWPADEAYIVEVCSASEQLMNGCVWGGQGFVLSRLRGYTVYENPAGPGILVTPSTVTPGCTARWGFCIGPGGIYYVAKDGIRVTTGDGSTLLSDAIRPLFNGQTVNGYAPIDFTQESKIRLAVANLDLWLLYQDTNGTQQCLVYSLIYQYWRAYTFGAPPLVIYEDERTAEDQLENLVIMGAANSNAYYHLGALDDAALIPFSMRTGAWDFGLPRNDKLLGDLVLDADLQGIVLTVQAYLNIEATALTPQTLTGPAGRARYTLDPFGTDPHLARTVSLDISGVAPGASPVTLSTIGLAAVEQPDATLLRATTWGSPTGKLEQAYLWGCSLDCDTRDSTGAPQTKTVLVEVDLNGTVTTVATLSITHSRKKLWFSWPAVQAMGVRLRPTDSNQWLLYNVEWLATPEPPMIAEWDTNWENKWDSYYTGLDLECNTYGQPKTLHVLADGAEIAGSPFTVTTASRLPVHLTFTPGRAHLYRFYASDLNPGQLYSARWQAVEEPSEQWNWNQNFDDLGAPGQKYITGVVLEVDTFNQVKTVAVQIDGVTVETLSVQTNGRLTVRYGFQADPLGFYRGYVVRLLPTDSFPSRLYSKQWLFTKEPESTSRGQVENYEDLGDPGDKYITGLLIECDTLNAAKIIDVEIDGTVVEVLSVTANGRQTINFNFPGGPYYGKIVRIIPQGTGYLQVWSKKWEQEKEPDQTAGFAVLNFHDLEWVGEKYLTGIIVECSTLCVPKYMWVEVDGVVLETILLQTPQRAIQQFHFAGGPYPASKVVRLLPADTTPGKLFATRWLFDPEPVNNAGFGVQNWSVLGYPSDKYVKGIILEADTHGAVKTVRIEADGAGVLATLNVQTTGRQVVELSFPQALGRVIRLRAIDANPGKLYSAQWIFDLEPLALARWETQLLDFGFPGSGWGSLLSSDVCLRATSPSLWTITVYDALGRLLQTQTYPLPSTFGAKQKLFVPFLANKGVLYKFVFTTLDNSPTLTLYQEESRLRAKGWSSGGVEEIHGFGNDDLDVTRNMREANVAAQRSGGGSR